MNSTTSSAEWIKSMQQDVGTTMHLQSMKFSNCIACIGAGYGMQCHERVCIMLISVTWLFFSTG